MTIDERLERLAERHGALAQSIELLTHDISELRVATEATAAAAAAALSTGAGAKERHEALTQSVELLVAEGRQTGEKIRNLAVIAEQNEVPAGQMMETMSRLGRILEIHHVQIDGNEHRIRRLEG